MGLKKNSQQSQQYNENTLENTIKDTNIWLANALDSIFIVTNLWL